MTSDNTPERREFGHVYRRGRIWWVRYSVDGQRRREKTGSAKKRDAERLLAKREAELGLGRLPEPDVRHTSFEDLADIIENDYEMRGRKSLPRLKTALRHLREFFGGARAMSITHDRLTEYVVHRQTEGASNSSIQKELAAIRRAFRLAKRAKKVSDVPDVPTLELNNTRTGFIEARDAIFDRYDIVEEDELREAVRRLAEHRGDTERKTVPLSRRGTEGAQSG